MEMQGESGGWWSKRGKNEGKVIIKCEYERGRVFIVIFCFVFGYQCFGTR